MPLELRTCPICKQEKVKLLDFSPKQKQCKECNRQRCKDYRKSLGAKTESQWKKFKL